MYSKSILPSQTILIEIHTTIITEKWTTSTSTRLKLDFLSFQPLYLTILDDYSRLVRPGRFVVSEAAQPNLLGNWGLCLPGIWALYSTLNTGNVSALIPVLLCCECDLLLCLLLSWHVGVIWQRLAWVFGGFGRWNHSDSSRVDDVDQRTRQENLLGKRKYTMKICPFLKT